MSNATQQSNTNTVLPLIGRVLLAAIFLLSGFGKIAAPDGTIGYIAAMGLPLPVVGLFVAIGVELIGGALLVLGYKTRITALVLAVFSVATGLIFHHAIADQNQMIHLLKNFAMAGGLLQVVAFGAGAFSLDNRKASQGALRTA